MGSFKDYNVDTGRFNRLLYTTVARDGDMKLVISTGLEKNLKPIEKCHTNGSIYVILRSDGKLKSINTFDASGNKVKQIDLDHRHNDIQPHVHDFSDGSKYHPRDGKPLNIEDLQLVKRAEKLLEEYKS